MLKKIYCGGAFDFDCRDTDYIKTAQKDYRVVSVLKNTEKFLRACAVQHLSDKLDYIGPFYYETEDMKGEDIVAKELENARANKLIINISKDADDAIIEL